MFIFIKRLISAILSFIFAMLPFGSNNPEKKCDPVFNGTFIQSWMSSYWDDARWQTEIQNMKDAGIEYLIIQDVATKSTDDIWTVYYDSTLPAFENADFGEDVIETALRNCDGSGIKVFVGLALFDDFWTEGAITGQYKDMCKVAADMSEEIYDKYYNEYPDTFYGWYFTPEVNNIIICNINMIGICKGLNILIDRIDSIDSSLPLLLSPFYSDYLSTLPLTTLANWIEFFKLTHFRDGDIFAPQDAVGAAWTSEKNLERNWKMYSEAIKSADADVKLWANCENFTSNFADTAFDGIVTRPATENQVTVTATLDRFVRQLDIASKYAENIITFSYNHYYSPDLVNPCFINTYLNYKENGFTLESEAPSSPEMFTKQTSDNGITLTWNASTDNIGIAYYRICRNGKFLSRIELFEDPDTSLIYNDASGSLNDEYTITAFDAAGNISAVSYAK